MPCRRHRAEILKRGLAPTQERVALLIALKFEQSVQLKSVVGAVVVHLHGVVDDQIEGTSGLAFLGSAPIFLSASRMAARSTTHGTPVKSCKTTRAGRN